MTLLLSKLATLALTLLTKYRTIKMSEPKEAHDIIMSAIKAEDSGVPVNWKEMLLRYHEAAVAEIQRLKKENEDSESDVEVVNPDPM